MVRLTNVLPTICTRHSGLCSHSVQEINMGTYHITITVLSTSARATFLIQNEKELFLIQSRAPYGVLDYRYATSANEALAIAESMRSWNHGSFTNAPITWFGR